MGEGGWGIFCIYGRTLTEEAGKQGDLIDCFSKEGVSSQVECHRDSLNHNLWMDAWWGGEGM